MRSRTQTMLTFAAVAAGLVVAAPKAAVDPTVKKYAVGTNGYETTRIISVGDTVPETSDSSKQFQMVGIQDGLGAPPVGPGVWETSGIIDTAGLFGAGTWLFDVQAHSPTPAPKPNTVEDGQLLLLAEK